MTILLSSLINAGGGGAPIDSVQPFNDTVNVKTDSNSNIWLKSGVLETDTSLYPDAFKSNRYTGTNFTLAPSGTIPEGIAWDSVNNKFWVVDRGAQTVSRYKPDGSYDSFNFSVSAQDTSPFGITFDGSDLWITGLANKSAYKYTTGGSFVVGSDFNIGVQDSTPYGIAWDGTHLRVVGGQNKKIYRYTAAGSYTGTGDDIDIDHATIVSPQGLVFHENHLWVTDTQNDGAYQYNLSKEYTGINFDISGEDNDPFGIAHNGTEFVIVGRQNDTVFYYQESVGLPNASTDSDTGLPNYVRVK